jgi:type VI secretion system protein ImpE
LADADALLRDGDLDGARSALIEIVRSQPSNEPARMFLFQLLAIVGDWDRARSQLGLLAQLSPEAQMLSVTYGQAVDAEKARADVFAGKTQMPVLINDDGWAADLALAIAAFAKGNVAVAEEARDRAFDAAPDTPGSFNGKSFDWIADADGRFGPSFEAIIAGKYGIVPFDAVSRITSEGPEDLRDTIWFPVQIAFKSGLSTAAFLPARYPGSENAADSAERLGRATAWTASDGGEVGSGQRLWTLSDGEDMGLLSLTSLVFD